MRAEAVPNLPRGVRLHRCRVRGAWFLLAPERALKLDGTGQAILAQIDGRRNVAEIARALAETYEAPADRIVADTLRFLAQLHDRCILDLR